MCIALLAYGREELHHGKPETDVYEMKVETLVEPFKEAFFAFSRCQFHQRRSIYYLFTLVAGRLYYRPVP